MLFGRNYGLFFIVTALSFVLFLAACGSETVDNGQQGASSETGTRKMPSGNSTPVITASQEEPGGAESGILAGLLEMGSPESPEPLSPGQESTTEAGQAADGATEEELSKVTPVPSPTPILEPTPVPETVQDTDSPDQETARTVIPESTPTESPTITAFPDSMPGALSGFKSVSVGAGYTCAISDNDALECWGSSHFGLDNPPDGEYAQVSAGNSLICISKVDGNNTSTRCGPGIHACALSTDGDVTCWGDLSLGQRQVPPGKYLRLSAGGAHSCGLRTDFTIACWGYNAQGQAIAPSGTFTSVSAGGAHSCAIRDGGSMECWGGDASTASSGWTCRVDSQGNANCESEATVGSVEVPLQVMAPEGTFKAVASGSYHSCAIRTDGSLHCWGDLAALPQIDPGARFVFVDVGQTSTCALTEDGTPHCWDGSAGLKSYEPGRYHTTGKFESISAGVEHHCGITSKGPLYCWGDNSFGQVVPFGGRHKAVSVDWGKSCSIREDGSAGCWFNNSSQLITAIDDYGPTGQPLYGSQNIVNGPEGTFSQVSATQNSSMACGLKEDGSVHCWDINRRAPPVTLEGSYLAISPANRLCGARTEGGVVCWELDHASDSFIAEDVSDMTGTYMALSSGIEHICGILQDGRVECSEAAEGFHGPGRADPPDGRFISISAAKDNTCGVRDDGKLECWGWYPFLQKIPESGNFVQVVSNNSKACALTLDGAVECWGAFPSPPVGKSFESISLAHAFTLDLACGVLRDGRISCWRW